MELVLIRHGQAEERSGDQSDDERSLTDEGLKSLDDALMGYCRLINGRGAITVWSSPLKRALQTAQVIAKAIGIKEIKQTECIGSGNFEAFLSLLTESESSDPDDCLVVVGHEPWLSQWSRQLCGLSLPFRKGAAAGLKVDTQAPLESELAWFVQPRILRRLGT